jgi:hypothetical protein
MHGPIEAVLIAGRAASGKRAQHRPFAH